MDSIRSSDPLESIALRFAGLGLLTPVNNLWTWVALVAAAGFSFMTTRSLTPPILTAAPIGHTTSFPDDPQVGYPSEAGQTVGVGLGCDDDVSSRAAVVAEPDPDASSSLSSVTKGNKFIIAYYEDECMCPTTGDENVHDDNDEKAVENGVWWEKWEKAKRMKGGETGWYRCQDIAAVLDGSVVRLWDGGRQGTTMRFRPAQTIIRCYGC